jgi:hypothetical protein
MWKQVAQVYYPITDKNANNKTVNAEGHLSIAYFGHLLMTSRLEDFMASVQFDLEFVKCLQNMQKRMAN